jgi:hypothetical protein
LQTSIIVGLLVLGTGTVAEQRARLPPPAECGDSVVGTWKSHQYHPDQGQWTQFTLEVSRVPDSPDQLTGFIRNHSWVGGATDEQPPPCRGDWRYKVSMDARGTLTGDHVEFWGIDEWRLDAILCGRMDFGYNLDHFSGDISQETQEFQSVNNDGGVAVNQPTLFRRIKCHSDIEPILDVEPPPFHPPSLGCGW